MKNREMSFYIEWLKVKKHQSIVAAVAVLLLALIFYFAKGRLFGLKVPENVENIPVVEVQKLALGDLNRTLKFVGNLVANEHVVIKSEIDGLIKDIHFFEGQMVKAGDLLISFDDAAAAAQYEEAVAKYLNARADYEMTKKLAKDKYISESELNKKDAEMKVFYAQTKQVRNTLDKHKIFAPFDGKVGLKEISVGEYMNRGKDMLTLTDETPMKVDFKVPEMLISKIRVDQIVMVRVDGIDQEFVATVKAIDPVGERISHSFKVRAILSEEVTSAIYGIYPGQFVKLKIINDEKQKGILVPQNAIIRLGDSDVIYRILDGSSIQTEVIVGDVIDGRVEIIGGLSDGDVIVVNGQERIRDGMKVRTISQDDLSQNQDLTDDVIDDEPKNIRKSSLNSAVYSKKKGIKNSGNEAVNNPQISSDVMRGNTTKESELSSEDRKTNEIVVTDEKSSSEKGVDGNVPVKSEPSGQVAAVVTDEKSSSEKGVDGNVPVKPEPSGQVAAVVTDEKSSSEKGVDGNVPVKPEPSGQVAVDSNGEILVRGKIEG